MAKQPNRSDLVYGRWPVKEALESSTVSKVFISKNADRASLKDVMALLNQKRVQYVWVDKKRLDQLAPGNHQGVAAYVSPIDFAPYNIVLKKALASEMNGVRLIFLDEIQDPQNLGAIIRSAAFFGVSGVVVPKWRGAAITGTVVKTSAGAARVVPLAQVSNLSNALEKAKEAGFWIAGADMDGDPLKKSDPGRPLALVMGAEGKGLHRLVKEKCDYLFAAEGDPARPGTASLNVSVACGMFLHHFFA